ncbi:MAG: protein-ADP-ribose hydrolase [Lachnospiraceae bacterium]
MKDNNFTDDLLETLKKDSADYKELETRGYNRSEKKNCIRSLMNIRMPKPVSEELLQLQDAYLKQELLEKGVMTLEEIPTIKDEYGSMNLFSEKISLWKGDITRLKVGAIVNAANSQMLGCFIPCHRCIDNAIHSAAGIQLRNECNHIMQQKRIHYGRQYEEPTGTAVLTKGYNLPCDHVIHTVGPIVYGALNDQLRGQLRDCYRSVLQCCMEHGIKTVAFCCISTGEFHFPKEEAAKIAWETTKKFLETHGGIERVIFNVFQDEDRRIYEKILGLD